MERKTNNTDVHQIIAAIGKEDAMPIRNEEKVKALFKKLDLIVENAMIDVRIKLQNVLTARQLRIKI
jgi:hypothetical protein